mmetsp:Transcript_8313/g.27222  ORF Transcript_8313/g.27222 Transcript_8313/m.27222 type:complete len:292 (+) Transcript_8313:1067-1942(+)
MAQQQALGGRKPAACSGEGCCGSHTARWAVALLTCASISMIGMLVTTILTGWFTGPSMTVMESFVIITLVGVIVMASVAMCCVMEERTFQMLGGFAVAYLLVGLVAIVVWSASVRTAAQYNCSFKVDCDSQYSSSGLGCDGNNKQFVGCVDPKVRRRGGDLHFSLWGDDCTDDGGDDDTCRGFTSRSDCVKYENPLEDDVEKCDGKGTTVEEAIADVVGALCTITILTMIPALGFALSVFAFDGSAPLSAATEQPPVAHSVVEMGTVTGTLVQPPANYNAQPATVVVLPSA